MAKLDFPSSPTFNQRYPDPAVPGIPVYTWDTEKWVASGPVGSPPQAPFDAMAYSGMQINGGMDVSQESGTAVVTGNTYVVDGMFMAYGGPTITAQQVTDAPPGFSNSIKLTVTVAKPTLAAGDYAAVGNFIEGYRTSRLDFGKSSAQPVTVSFWCKTHRTGLYSFSVQNSANTRVYHVTYTQTTADTWQYQSATIPGDTTGTWEITNLCGMGVNFALAGGTAVSTAPNVWSGTANTVAATGIVNGVAATSDTFQITGVTVLPGTQAPTAAQSPNIMRPYGEELATCLRYYRRTDPATSEWTVYGYAAGAGYYFGYSTPFPVPMRAVPTVSYSGTFYTGNTTLAVPSIDPGANSYAGYVISNGAGQVTAHPNSSGIIRFDARL